MGWTHYWERQSELPSKLFERAAMDCNEIMAEIDVSLAGFESEGKPIFNREEIVSCGVKGLDCETFVIKTTETPRRAGRPVLSYSKTEKLPYDLCVKCALVILKHHLGDHIRVMSDGTN